METRIESTVKKFRIVFILVSVVCFIIIGRIIAIQYFADHICTEDDIYRERELEATRGSILAFDGRPMVTSVSVYDIRMDCTVADSSDFENGVAALSQELSDLFKDKSAREYEKDLRGSRKDNKRYKKIGNRSVNFFELEKIQKFPIYSLGKYKGGLIVESGNKRIRPYGSLALRTVGYINNVGEGAGIEKSYDYKLKGVPGVETIHRQIGGDWIPVQGAKSIPPENGYDIQTTIDIDIQETAEEALRYQLSLDDVFEGGTAVVMEVGTGAIRAIANMKKTPGGKFDETYNYAIGDATEPGSTMKLASLVCLIEDGYVTLDTPIDAGNGEWMYMKTKFSDTKRGGYGLLNVKQAFEKSSNISFAKLVIEHYGDKEEEFVSKLHALKLNEKLNLEIEGEGFAQIMSPKDQMWSKVSLPMMGMGYAVLLTPLHTLTFYNAIANNGKMMKPYFIESFQRNGSIVEQFSPQVISGSICSKSTITEVKKALRGVVEHGTAAKFNDERYQIAGKTGTAQIAFDGKYKDSQGYKKHQASFAGYFPADNPKYSCIVVLYTAKTRANFYGGSWAAPVFKMIADKVYTAHPEWKEAISGKGIVPPDNPNFAVGSPSDAGIILPRIPMKEKISIKEKTWTSEKGVVPNVTDMGLKDALYLLENEGYIVSFTGKGRVQRQIPEGGTALDKNGKVIIELSETTL